VKCVIDPIDTAKFSVMLQARRVPARPISKPSFPEAAMKALFVSVALVGALLAVDAYADAPAGATALCKDGTYYSGTTHKGACKGHQGVKDWLDKTADATTAPKTASDTATTTKSKAKTKTTDATTPATTDATASKAKSKSKKPTDAATPVAPATTAAPATTVAPAATAAPASTAASSAKSTAPKSEPTPPTPASQITQKPGGGAGMVWVNSTSKVYHCPGDEWYGKTKEGSYMTEAAAKSAGNHGSHGKECTAN
jgi:flagellar hook-length control protein FliK